MKDMKDVKITVCFGRGGAQYEVSLQLDDGATCGEVVKSLLHSLDLPQRHDEKGGWRLVEYWRGRRGRAIPSSELVVPLYTRADRKEVKLCLRRRVMLKDKRSFARRVRYDIKHRPAFCLLVEKTTGRKLFYLRQLVRKELQRQRKRYRSVLYKRLAANEPLWTPRDMTPLDLLRLELGALRESNLVLSSEVADLNITSTDLRSKLNQLRQKSLSLSDQLSKLEEEVRTKKEERERRGPRNMAQVQTEMIKIKRELEVRNRLNANQNTKLKTKKELLREKQNLLAEKKKELEQLKLRKPKKLERSCDHHVLDKSSEMSATSPSREANAMHTPPRSSAVRHEPPVSSASRKRHASIFEVKTRQLVEEERKVFRQLHAKRLDFEESDENEATHPIQTHLDRKPEDRVQCLKVDDGAQTTARSLTRPQVRSDRHVHFTAEALILNAALEGELELLKECTRKLGSCLQSSDQGATCLHNAVCSGNMDVVRYLVEQGCSVNAQDIDGWTPLHCAAAYRNQEMMEYLLCQGASLYLTTKDGDTPLNIIVEDYKTVKDEEKDVDQTSKSSQLLACLNYLSDLHQELGHINNGVVYTQFPRQAKDSDELGFSAGERLQVLDRGDHKQWWLARNTQGQEGLVPCTFLGLYKPQELGTLL